MYKYKNVTDTMFLNRIDSVSVPHPVAKKLSAWQQVKINYGGWAIAIVFVFILIIVGFLVYKLKK